MCGAACTRCCWAVTRSSPSSRSQPTRDSTSSVSRITLRSRATRGRSGRAQPLFGSDLTRSQRALKIRAHATVPEYDFSVYIDNSILLKVPPERLVADLLPAETGLAVMAHGFRATVADEFAEVVALGFDTFDRCAEQEHHYRVADPEGLALRPLKAGLLLRRHHQPLVTRAMELWASHVLRYSRRDQLSFWVCLREAGLEPLVHELDNFESPYHRWSVSVGRTPVDRLWPDLHRELSVATSELASARQKLTDARDRVLRLESVIEAQRGTRSWRWTEPARRLRGAFPMSAQPSASSVSTSPEPSHAPTSR